jgi:hypothetical protein
MLPCYRPGMLTLAAQTLFCGPVSFSSVVSPCASICQEWIGMGDCTPAAPLLQKNHWQKTMNKAELESRARKQLLSIRMRPVLWPVVKSIAGQLQSTLHLPRWNPRRPSLVTLPLGACWSSVLWPRCAAQDTRDSNLRPRRHKAANK